MAKVENFIEWTKGAQWAICHLLTYVTKEEREETPIDIRIEINGTVVEDLQVFFEGLMRAKNSQVQKAIAAEILSRFDGVGDLWYELYHSARDALKNELKKEFNVHWNEDEIYSDWIATK